ncbi:MAG: protein translocase subunit SecD, partial [Rhodospirillales bacterium]|nr:protein translocase subunit SecD [Rhodospirillales bacterium]
MLYFSRLKTATVLGVCLLGLLLALPNALPAPAAWLPWRTVHLGLDLRGGSYLLMQVDMAAVTRERLTSLAESARQALRQAGLARYRVTADDAQQRLVVNGLEPGTEDKAFAALQPLAQTTSTGFSTLSDLNFARRPDGSITVTLAATAL